jgi:hypothetical protein
MAHLEPPAGLSDEWQVVFRALADQLYVVAAYYSHPDPHLLPLESLTAWLDAFRRTAANAQEVKPYLHGRAPKTWNLAHEIDQAIFPVHAVLGSAVGFLTEPLPVTASPEQQAASSRRRLAELRGFDARPLLDDLAAAVTDESGVRLGLSLTQPPPAPGGEDVKSRALNATEQKILKHCRRAAHTGERIATHCGLTYDHTRRVLARLKKEGYLRMTGGGYRTVPQCRKV